jgi:hypothetical protein
VVAAAAKLPSLLSLSLACCPSVSDAAVAALASKVGALEELSLDDCAKVGDAALRALAANCRRLRALSLRRCAKVTDAGLAAVAERCPLRRLAVAGAQGFGPAAVGALARCCAGSLEALDLSFCRGAPEAALGLLLDGCRMLRELRVYGCTQVTDCMVNGHSNDEVRVQGLATSVRTCVA